MFPEKYFLISDYQSMELLGVNGLFTNFRVDRESLPEGFYKYSLREGEDDFFSSVKSNVLVNHMGDFICKQELDLNGQNECDLFGDYDFTNKDIDLDEFFGEDVKLKIAQEIDAFCYDFDTYEYQDNVPPGTSREDVVLSVKDGLSDKKYVEGMVHYFEKLLDDNDVEEFLEPADEQKARSFVRVLTEINTHNRDSLDSIVGFAEEFKEKQAQEMQNQEPEIQQGQ